MYRWLVAAAVPLAVVVSSLASPEGAMACRTGTQPPAPPAVVPSPVRSGVDTPPVYKPNPNDPCDIENNPWWGEFYAWRDRQTQKVDVIPPAPANTGAPTIQGETQEHETLTASDASWGYSGPMAFIYQWYRCDSSGSGCVAIDNMRGKAYTLGSADIGSTIRVTVTAGNAGGLSQPSPQSAPTSVVAPGVVTGEDVTSDPTTPTDPDTGVATPLDSGPFDLAGIETGEDVPLASTGGGLAAVQVPTNVAAAGPKQTTCHVHWGRILSSRPDRGDHKGEVHYRWASSMSCESIHQQWGSGLVVYNTDGAIRDSDAVDYAYPVNTGVLEFKGDFYEEHRHRFHIHSNFYVTATPGYKWTKVPPRIDGPNGASRYCFLSDPFLLHCITDSMTTK
jgi:hypothetical protein